MENKELLEMQKRLDEKRGSSKQTNLTRIGSGECDISIGDVIGRCDCGSDVLATESTLFFRKMGTKHMVAELCGKCTIAREKRWEEEAKERDARAADARREENFIRMKKESGIGEKFIDSVWSDYQPVNSEAAKVLEVCQEYAAGFTRSSCDLVMVGSCGTGKNMLSALIGLDIMRKGFGFSYTTAMRLVRKVKDSWRDKDVSEQSVVDSFTYPSLLCIDEIGVQFGSPTEQLYITEVINNRYEANKPTILISNLKLPQIEEVLGSRAIDRFHERGKFLVFNWDSYRRRK